MRALVIEDNPALSDGIATALSNLGLAVDVSLNGEEASDIVAIQDYDLIILDLNLPDKDGLDILKELRARGSAAQVLILTARADLTDRVKGLDLGADDYLTKPFELVELEARVRALTRRLNGQKTPLIHIGLLQFDTLTKTVKISDQIVNLPKRELSLLELFINKANTVLSKEQIADGLANFDQDMTPNAVEIYISRLRKKLEAAHLTIKTIRGIGYIFEKPDI